MLSWFREMREGISAVVEQSNQLHNLNFNNPFNLESVFTRVMDQASNIMDRIPRLGGMLWF